MNLLTIKDAVELTGLSDQTVRNMIDKGKIQKYDSADNITRVSKKEILVTIPTTITFFNQKGGVGKTTMSVLLTDYLEKHGYKVLLVDLDQQGNLSQTFFQYEDLKKGNTLFDYFYNRTPLIKIVKEYNKNIDVLPADIRLARKDNLGVEELIELKADFQPIFKKYNVVIIDCPPALNSFSRFGILLANYIFCPVHPSAYSYDGSFEVLRTINKFVPQGKHTAKLNPDCIDYRFLISKHHYRRFVIKDDYIKFFKEEYGEKLFDKSIPEFIGIEERAVEFKNIFDMYQNDKSVDRIKELCEEIEYSIYEGR